MVAESCSCSLCVSPDCRLQRGKRGGGCSLSLSLGWWRAEPATVSQFNPRLLFSPHSPSANRGHLIYGGGRWRGGGGERMCVFGFYFIQQKCATQYTHTASPFKKVQTRFFCRGKYPMISLFECGRPPSREFKILILADFPHASSVSFSLYESH